MTKNKRLIIIFSAIALLTALIIINSAVFSVRSVFANSLNYPNSDSEVLHINEMLENHHGIRMGSSIFMLNEERTIEAIRRNLIEHEELAHIEIRSLERLFPNRVVIHYVVLRPYFYIFDGGQAYIFSNNETLIRIVESVAEARSMGALGLFTSGELVSRNLGDVFETSEPQDALRFNAVISTFERLVHRDLQHDFRYVDLRNPTSIFIRMSSTPGLRIEIRTVDNFLTHFSHGFSVYRAFLISPDLHHKTMSGTLLITETAAGQIVATHSFS